MATRSSLNPLPDILARFLKTHGMASRMLEFTLQQHWIEIAGEHIGRHTRPESIRHHKLYLVAENSVWLQQLLFLKPELLAKLNGIADGEALTDIVLRVGVTLPAPDSSGPAAGQPEALPIEPTEPALTQAHRQTALEETLRPIADPDLQARLRALFENSGLTAARPALKEHPRAR
ncbi:MAG TPA: DUF721 domain-containing protein [Nitrospirales bacterium]|jgi:hypothetical protein|nr:DUF721 domain-containing protein [Nitrospirales bacterium]